jgi:hypothetical protein
MIRRNRKCGSIAGGGFLRPAQHQEGDPEIVVRDGMIRRLCDGLAETNYGLVRLALADQGDSQLLIAWRALMRGFRWAGLAQQAAVLVFLAATARAWIVAAEFL